MTIDHTDHQRTKAPPPTMRKSKRKPPKLEEKEPPESMESREEFSAAITRVAVAQICRSVGFSAAHPSALQTLARVAAFYLRALAASAASRAALCGRTQSNLSDVAHALQTLAVGPSLHGASDVNRPLLSSSPLRAVLEFFDSVDETPFAAPIHRRREMLGTSGSSDRELRRRRTEAHIPAWLPAFPDPGSYVIARWSSRSNNLLLEKLGQTQTQSDAGGGEEGCRTTTTTTRKRWRRSGDGLAEEKGRRWKVMFKIGKRGREDRVG